MIGPNYSTEWTNWADDSAQRKEMHVKIRVKIPSWLFSIWPKKFLLRARQSQTLSVLIGSGGGLILCRCSSCRRDYEEKMLMVRKYLTLFLKTRFRIRAVSISRWVWNLHFCFSLEFLLFISIVILWLLWSCYDVLRYDDKFIRFLIQDSSFNETCWSKLYILHQVSSTC